jgi:hypothetical protein
LYVVDSQITLKNCSIRDNTSEQTTGGGAGCQWIQAVSFRQR